MLKPGFDKISWSVYFHIFMFVYYLQVKAILVVWHQVAPEDTSKHRTIPIVIQTTLGAFGELQLRLAM